MNMESAAGLYSRWVTAYIQRGIDGVKMECKPGGTKSSITDEDRRDYSTQALFNDPHMFGYLRNTWSLSITCKLSDK